MKQPMRSAGVGAMGTLVAVSLLSSLLGGGPASAAPKGDEDSAAALVGTWASKHTPGSPAAPKMTVTFQPDGRFLCKGTGIAYPGHYTADKVKIYVTREGFPLMTIRYVRSGNRLTLKGALGGEDAITLTRQGAAAGPDAEPSIDLPALPTRPKPEPKGDKESSAALVGIWTSKHVVAGLVLHDITLQFRPDGRFHYVHSALKHAGTYAADKTQIYLTLEKGGTVSVPYTRRGDRLSVTGLLGVPMPVTLTRQGGPPPPAPTHPVPGPAAPPAPRAPPPAAVDLSTPLKAAQAFIQAAQAKKLDVLRQCVSARAVGLLRAILSKTPDAKSLAEIRRRCQRATKLVQKMTSRTTGVVSFWGQVQLEALEMALEGDAWKARQLHSFW